MPVVVVSGLRQVGKSTLLQQAAELAQGRRYVTLDDYAALAAARENPEATLQGGEAVTIDEVQKCPELLTAIKREVDRNRQAGRFLLSGSANLALMHRVAETLAGRAVYLTLQPMSRRERRAELNRPPHLMTFLETGEWPNTPAEPVSPEEILRGGLPPVCLEPSPDAALWFKGYEQTYIERDVRQLAQVADLIAFRTLTQLAALRTGQVLNLSQLARDAKLTATTATRYVHLLETTFLVHKLPPFLRNRSTRLIKSPKLYFTDSGLAAHLAGVRALPAAADEPLRGPLIETYVVQNLAALVEAHLPELSLHYWHEQGRHEVDVVLAWPDGVLAIEVKAATRWDAGDLVGLRAFRERTRQCRATLLAYNGTQAVRLQDGLWAVPLGHLLG